MLCQTLARFFMPERRRCLANGFAERRPALSTHRNGIGTAFFPTRVTGGSHRRHRGSSKAHFVRQIWMVSVAAILSAFTTAGITSPLLLLILTFALASGDAFESPTWRAVLPELVDNDDLAAASALNGIEFNFARAVGPALRAH